MKKLVKGSKAAKDFMAKIRAKRKSKTAPKKAAVKKAAVKKAAAKKIQIGSINKFNANDHAIDEIKYLIKKIASTQIQLDELFKVYQFKNSPQVKKVIKSNINYLKNLIKTYSLQVKKLKTNIK